MLTLYKYIHESLLDDEEDLVGDENAIYNNYASMLNKLQGDGYNWQRPGIPVIICPVKSGPQNSIIIKDGVLGSNVGKMCYIRYPEIEKYDKVFHTVAVDRLGIFADNGYHLKNLFFKNIYTSALTIGDRYHSYSSIELKDINIYIDSYDSISKKFFGVSIPGEYRSNPTQLFTAEHVSLDNCTIKSSGKDIHGMRIEFDGLASFPEFNNCKFECCHQIIIMGLPIFFKNKNVLSTLDKVFKKCEYPYGDSRDGLFKKVNGFKDIISIIKNPKKYHYVSRGPEAKPRMSIDNFINEESNLSDAFPWVNDFKSLNTIYIISNKVKIKFMKKTSSFSAQRLCTKDGWCVSLEYYKY